MRLETTALTPRRPAQRYILARLDVEFEIADGWSELSGRVDKLDALEEDVGAAAFVLLFL